MTRAHALLVLVCCSWVGCGPLSQAPRPTAPFSDVAERWYRATGVEPPAFVVTWAYCDDSPSLLGYWRARDRVIAICTRTSPLMYEPVMLHEVGHALGAAHHSGVGIMRAALAGQQCITPDDVDAVCSRRQCQWERPEC